MDLAGLAARGIPHEMPPLGIMVEVPADVMTSEFAGNDVDYTAIRPTRSAGTPAATCSAPVRSVSG